MSKIKFCITGGSGFIGTTAMSWALSKYETVNFDISPPKNWSTSITGNLSIYEIPDLLLKL